jgi:hypothetical protein
MLDPLPFALRSLRTPRAVALIAATSRPWNAW